LHGKILLNDAEEIFEKSKGKSLPELESEFNRFSEIVPLDIIHEMFSELSDFIQTDPQIPDNNKNYIDTTVPDISIENNRDEIIKSIGNLYDKSELCTLALYVYRQMDKVEWLPFVKAAIERNPVCFTDLNGKDVNEVYNILNEMPDESIYDDRRLALPDEVWNFRRGDGIEKALLLADFIINKDTSASVLISVESSKISMDYDGHIFSFKSNKSFRKTIKISFLHYSIL
jgi:hypothetical protein